MKEIKPELETFARIKVIGVGGSGNHAISRMMEANLKGIDFIAVNADAQDLHHCKVPEKIHIGKNLTRGLGAGMNPDIGRQAAEENKDEIQDTLKNADMVFVTCGLGGGTGTGAAPIIAEVAKDTGALTVAVVTKPFSFEGLQRKKIADTGLEELRGNVDTIITIPNDKLLQVIDKKTPLLDSFKIVDDVLRQAVQGISDLITMQGIVNVDFADVKTIMKNSGPALMGIGRASGDNRATEAAKMAINSPLLELSIDGARGVLFNISGGPDLSMMEVHDAAQVITESVDPEAKVIFGAIVDEELKKGEIKITVIATGFQVPGYTVRTYERMLDEVEHAAPRPATEPATVQELSESVFRPRETPMPAKQEAVNTTKKDLSASLADIFKKDAKEKIREESEPVKEPEVQAKPAVEPRPVAPVEAPKPATLPETRPTENFISRPTAPEKKPEPNNSAKPFSSKVSDVRYVDEYDVPAFLRRKMDKNKNNLN